jgi:membrane-bound serine protease (ClpP class)
MSPTFRARPSPQLRRKSGILVLLWLGLLLCLAVSPALAQDITPGAVVVLPVNGVIDPVTAGYVELGIRSAVAGGARLVVIRLDTPGGLDTAMRTTVQAILNAEVPVVVYVAPSGARAASAGVFITAAAHVAAMAPGTNIGAAHPVSIGGETQPDETMADKVTNDAVAYLRAIAEQRNRNTDLAEKLVRESQSLSAQQALDERLVDLVAADLPSLLAVLEGRRVRVANGNEVTLHLGGAPIEERPMNWLQVVTHGIVDPNIAYVLLSLGTIALVAEFWNPGAIIPGVTGAICLVLAFVAFGSLPVNYGGVALIVLAIIFFLLDIKITGFGLTIAGVVAFIIGSLLLFSPIPPPAPSMPRLSVSLWLVAGMTALMVLSFAFVVTVGWRALRRPDVMRMTAPAGAAGVAVSTLAPQGVVQVASEQWTAVAAEGTISAGEPVEVVRSEGLRLVVRSRK